MNAVTPFRVAAALSIALTTPLSAATIDAMPKFDFGMKNLTPAGADVTLWGTKERHKNNQIVTSCTLSSYKDAEMVAVEGELFRSLLDEGFEPNEAFAELGYAVIDRDTYKANAQYIVISDAEGEDNDFIRIQGGAPLKEGETKLYIGDQQIDAEIVKHEDNGYTIKITDQETFKLAQNTLAKGEEKIAVYLATVNSDYVIKAEFAGNMNVVPALNDCLENSSDMNIPMSEDPNIVLGRFLSFDKNDVVGLMGQTCGYDHYANADDYAVREIGSTTSLFIPSHKALEKDGIIQSGDYLRYNTNTGGKDISNSMRQFNSHGVNSCMGESIVAPSPIASSYYSPPVVTTPVARNSSLASFGGAALVGGILLGSHTHDDCGCTHDDSHDPKTPPPAVVPLPSSLPLIVSGLVGLAMLRRRKMQGKLKI